MAKKYQAIAKGAHHSPEVKDSERGAIATDGKEMLTNELKEEREKSGILRRKMRKGSGQDSAGREWSRKH